MSLQTPHDIPLLITVLSDPNDPKSKPLVSAERRITPTWSVSTLKSKLEPVTGIPSTSMTLRTKSLHDKWVTLTPDDALVGDGRFGLTKGSEIEIVDGRPPGTRAMNDFSDVGSVEKYVMPEEQYEKLNDSVLAWKKRQGLGRFAQSSESKSQDELAQERREHDQRQIVSRAIQVGVRCRVSESDERRGFVKFVGEVVGLGGVKEEGCIWVGVEFDEPVGRNNGVVEIIEADGSEERKVKRKVFDCKGENYGALVRPVKVEAGPQWTVLDDLLDEDMEEI